MQTTCPSVLSSLLLLAGLLAGAAAAQSSGPESTQPPPAGWTQPETSPTQAAADQFTHGLRVRPTQVSQAVARVTRELTWHKTLPAAVREAKLTGRPIVWVQAFGDLKGFT